MDHADSLFYERFSNIMEEQKREEIQKIDDFQSKAVGKKNKKVKLETSFSSLIFSFIEEQSTAIRDALSGEKLIEFFKRLIEQLVSAVTTTVSLSLEFEAKSP